jgi:hypothetical protein
MALDAIGNFFPFVHEDISQYPLLLKEKAN